MTWKWRPDESQNALNTSALLPWCELTAVTCVRFATTKSSSTVLKSSITSSQRCRYVKTPCSDLTFSPHRSSCWLAFMKLINSVRQLWQHNFNQERSHQVLYSPLSKFFWYKTSCKRWRSVLHPIQHSNIRQAHPQYFPLGICSPHLASSFVCQCQEWHLTPASTNLKSRGEFKKIPVKMYLYQIHRSFQRHTGWFPVSKARADPLTQTGVQKLKPKAQPDQHVGFFKAVL